MTREHKVFLWQTTMPAVTEQQQKQHQQQQPNNNKSIIHWEASYDHQLMDSYSLAFTGILQKYNISIINFNL